MRRWRRSWRIALAVLLLLGLAGGAFYWDRSSPTRRTQRLLKELEGREAGGTARNGQGTDGLPVLAVVFAGCWTSPQR